MRIAVSQINTRAGDLEYNAGRMAEISHAAALRDVDLLVFPPTVLTGLSYLDSSVSDAFFSKVAQTLIRLASCISCDCIVPVVNTIAEVPTVEAVLLHDGVATPLNLASWAFEISQQSELNGGPVDERPLARITIEDTSLGFAFSYADLDDWRDETTKPDVLCFFSTYGYAIDDASSALGASLTEARYREDVANLGAWFVGVGPVGGYDQQVFSGSSFVLSPDGRLAAVSPAFEEDLLVADVGANAQLDAGEEAYPNPYNESYHLWQALVAYIRDTVHKLGKADAVLALDGSWGSQLLAVLATDALGPTHVHAVWCVDEDARRCAEVAQVAKTLRLNVTTRDVQQEDDVLLATDYAMADLASLARSVDGVPLLSTDKTGLALEADGAGSCPGAFTPLGDVYRTAVIEVARYRNTVSPVFSNVEVLETDVPHVVGDVPAWECETLLKRIDDVLAATIEGGRSLASVSRSIDDEALALSVVSTLHDQQVYREGRFLYPALTTKTLFEVRLPLGFAWRDNLHDEADDATLAAVEEALAQIFGDHGDSHHQRRGEMPPLFAEAEIKDALNLLRDLSTQVSPPWHTMFSEN